VASASSPALVRNSRRDMYGLLDYARMVADVVRIDAYAGALADAVRPGSVVVDIGAGTGILSLMACKLGARRVFAIEPSDVLGAAEELARENGVDDRIEFFKADSRAIELPEQADVIVSDLRGSLPFHEDHLDVIIDARERFLAPGGVLIPERDILWAAVAECPDLYHGHVGPLSAPHGVTLNSALDRLRNVPSFQREVGSPEQLLVQPASWTELVYESIQSQPSTGRIERIVVRNGVAHGLLVWFEAVLGPGRRFSNAPGIKTIYPRTFLPFEKPLPVASGDSFEVELWVGPRGEPLSWNTTLRAKDGRTQYRSRQSTFLATPARPVALPRRGEAPGLTSDRDVH
jgi:protein arginine N-methyltransferase 1